MITYCTNIHPGESWAEIFSSLKSHIPLVRNAVSPQSRFPIGLRLSNRASLEVDERTAAQFYEWSDRNNCHVPTITGFVFGSFHSRSLKDNVYLPDWRRPERAEYTKRLARLLDRWLPADVAGSISTVPIGFKSHMRPGDSRYVKANVAEVLKFLDRLKQKSGKVILLSFEPEPGCVLETTRDMIRFVEKMNFPEELGNNMAICFDCCHHAVQFEDPEESMKLLKETGIRIGKIQVSSALRITGEKKEFLEPFCEPRYLHQVVVRRDGGELIAYEDLTDALRLHASSKRDEWRIHYHVPLFTKTIRACGTTASFAAKILSLTSHDTLHEVETYTWPLLPGELKAGGIVECIAAEIEWVKSRVGKKRSD